MKLRELKCKNCGSKIKIEENVTQVKCEYCHTSFALEDAYHDGYKFEKGRIKAQSEHIEKQLEDVGKIIRPVSKIFIARFVISIVIIIIMIVIASIAMFSFTTKQSTIENEFEINKFNSALEMYNGSEYGLSVGRLIDEISINNKKDKNHTITVIYKEITTQDPNQMTGIKKQLEDWTKYEVSFEYDKNGYIYQVTIE